MYSEKTNTKKMILEEHLFITAELATTIKKYLGGEEFQGEPKANTNRTSVYPFRLAMEL